MCKLGGTTEMKISETYSLTKQMHLHQPDWKSGVGAVDGGVDAGHHAHWPDVPDGWRA